MIATAALVGNNKKKKKKILLRAPLYENMHIFPAIFANIDQI